MRISDWSSDVCSSDLPTRQQQQQADPVHRRGQREPGGNARAQRDGQPQADPLALGLQPRLDRLGGAFPSARRPSRSEERRVGKECGSTSRSTSSPVRLKKKQVTYHNDYSQNNSTL